MCFSSALRAKLGLKPLDAPGTKKTEDDCK